MNNEEKRETRQMLVKLTTICRQHSSVKYFFLMIDYDQNSNPLY